MARRAQQVSESTCPSGPAAVECSPGYPMTLRLFNPVDDRVSPGSSASNDPDATGTPGLTLGYPVVDTPERAGHFCDAGRDGQRFSRDTVSVMCR